MTKPIKAWAAMSKKRIWYDSIRNTRKECFEDFVRETWGRPLDPARIMKESPYHIRRITITVED